MRRIFLTLIVLLSLLSISGFTGLQQNPEINIVIINRNNQTAAQITYSDTLKLQITLSQSVAQQETITFKLGGQASSVAICVIPNGKTTCATESFSALGWHWDPNGVTQNTRTVQAFNDNNETFGQSNPITVSPRPVVMVHGFLSNPETWAPYVGANGYLASMGVQGFAVGDGQVPGKLNTGDIDRKSTRLNSSHSRASRMPSSA